MLAGYAPFGMDEDENIEKRIRIGKFDFNDDVWKNKSKEVKTLIKSMILMDEEKRFSIGQVLKDPWFNKGAEVGKQNQSIERSMKTAFSNMRD